MRLLSRVSTPDIFTPPPRPAPPRAPADPTPSTPMMSEHRRHDGRSRRSASIATSLLVLATILLLHRPTHSEAKRADRNSPHVHRGTIKPYLPGSFDALKLDNNDERDLSSDKSVMKQIPDVDDPKGGGKAICVQDVRAPKSAVWNQILDMDHYVGKVSKLKACKNYLVRRNGDGSSTIKTMMKIGVLPGYSVS